MTQLYPEYRQRREERKDYVRSAKNWAIVATVFLIATILLAGGSSVANLVGPGYEYQDAVHSHMENAYWASTPELMIVELNLAMDGMRELGLKDGMSAKLMPWKQTPDWSMDYQFAHIEAIVERCTEVIAWRDAQDMSSGQVTDVYNQKMDNLKTFITDGGWSDDIATLAWYANYHTWYIFWGWIVSGALLCVMVFAYGKAMAMLTRDDRDNSGLFTTRIATILIVVMIVAVTLAKCLGA